MEQPPGFSLPSTTLLVEVDVAPELADIHNDFAPLLRLSGICAVPSATSVAVSSGVSAGNLSGSDEEEQRGRRSPAMSPVRAAENKLAELTAPVTVTLPPPMSNEDAAFLAHYVQSFRAREEAERAYIAFIFQEYKKRKSVEQKWSSEMEAMRQELEVLRQRELPPEVREAVEELVKREGGAREVVVAAYHNFLEWVVNTTPQWIEAAQRQEQARLADEKAKKAAMAAAREALARELAMGKQLGGSSGGGGSGGGGGAAFAASSRDSPSAMASGGSAAAVVNEDGTLSYEPAVSVEQQLEASQDQSTSLGASELRRKAIRMLEAEEEEMRRRREEQVRLLREQEEQLRAEIELKNQHDAEQAARKEREAAQKREDELAQRYNALLEQEFTLQSRVRQREEEKAKKEEERRMLMERVAAEEQLLRQRIQEKEDRRKASEEEAARVTRETMMREMREQEETLRRRLAEREAAAESARRAEAEKARRDAAAAAVCAEQEAALRRAKEERERAEKSRQLAYLRDQEAAYTRHLREKELAEIEAKRRAAEAHWTHPTLPSPQTNSSSLSVVSPMPMGSVAMPTPHAAPSTQGSYYATPQPAAPVAPVYPLAVAAAAPPPVMPGYGGAYAVPPPPPQAYAYPSPYVAYPVMPPPPQQPPMMMMQGYLPNPNPYYPQVAPPNMMAPMQPSPYTPAAMYPR